MDVSSEDPTKKRMVDAFAWSLNIFTSVAIVMVNKQLMGGSGYGFTFATTLCGLHFLCTSSIGLFTGSRKSGDDTNPQGEKMRVPPQDVAIFVAVAATSIIGLNMSLMLNTIGFYQVCKLAQIPTMCVLEAVFMGKKFSRRVIQAIVVVLLGVGVATVSDVEMNTQGTVAAIVGVVSTSMQQILVAHLQKKHSVTSNFLLAKTSPYMAGSMLLFGPVMDEIITGKWVFDYEWSTPATVALLVSCFFAVLVNVSSFLCIGRFSAVSFQVIGHVKTCLVFFFGWVIFAAPITGRNIIGCCLAVVGMIYYSHAVTKQQQTNSASGNNLSSKA
jgi:solute carrier family 35 protein E3